MPASSPIRHHARALLLLVGLAATALAQTPLQPARPPQAPTSTEPPNLAEARHLLDHKQFPAAEAQLRAILRIAPSSADASYLLAYTLLCEFRATDSLAAYTTAAALRPPTAADLTAVASDYILLKAYSHAERWLRLALTQTPADPRLWYLLGRTAYSQDNAEQAAEAFRHTLTLSPRDLRAEYNLGLAEEKLGHPDQARSAYTTAIAWQAAQLLKDPQPYLDLGLLELHENHPDQALPALEQATRLSPENPLAFETLGLTLDALHRPDDAIRALTTAATLAPTAERPHFFLGRIQRRLGHIAEAEDQFRITQQLLGTHSDTVTPNIDPQPANNP